MRKLTGILLSALLATGILLAPVQVVHQAHVSPTHEIHHTIAMQVRLALAYDTATYDTSWSNSGSKTVGNNPNRILVCNVGTIAGDTVSVITYAGVSMTLLSSTNWGSAATQLQAVYYLLAPATGSNTFTITTTPGDGNLTRCYSFYNISQGAPSFGNTTGSGTSPSTSITTSIDGSEVLGLFDSSYTGAGSTITASTNMTNNILPSSPRAESVVADMTAWVNKATAGSITHAVTPSGGTFTGNWNFYQVVLAPSGAAPLTSSIIGLVRAFWLR